MKKIFLAIAMVAVSFLTTYGQVKVTEIADVNYKTINIGNHGLGSYTKSVILLHEIYNGVRIEKNYAIGKITAMRGATGAYDRTNVVNVNTSSAYEGVKGSIIGVNSDASWKLITVSYNSKKYIALHVPHAAAWHHLGFQFNGWTYSSSENMKVVPYYHSDSVINTEINDSIEDFTPNMAEYHDVSKLVVNGGNVGIGTTSPSEKLEVNGNVSATGTLSLGAVASTTALRDVISLYGNRLGESNMYGFGVEGDGTLYNKAVNNHRWYLNSNANLGTSAKMELSDRELSVNGNFIVDNIDGEHSNIRLGHESNDRIIVDNSTAESYGGGFFFRVHNEDVGQKYIDAIMIAKNGNIGIGTKKTDDYKLTVAGSKGIIAEKVTVKLASQWPDYVFTNEYELPTLKEVEKQIKENGHLQNIPSAEEVEANGVELGDMSKNLLQKVEELTLYTIQQEKKLEQQNKEIEKLKVLVSKLIEAKK